jgi:hypothetical protein
MEQSKAPSPLAKMVEMGIKDAERVNDGEDFGGYMFSELEEGTGVLTLRFDPFDDRPVYRPITARFVELDKLTALLIGNGYDTVAEWLRTELAE